MIAQRLPVSNRPSSSRPRRWRQWGASKKGVWQPPMDLTMTRI